MKERCTECRFVECEDLPTGGRVMEDKLTKYQSVVIPQIKDCGLKTGITGIKTCTHLKDTSLKPSF